YGAGSAPIIDAALELSRDEWVEQGPSTWVYTAKLRQAERLIIDDRRIDRKPELISADPPGTWAWAAGKLHLRCAGHPRDAFGRIVAITRTCVQFIDADGGTARGIAAVNGVHGFLGQRSSRVSLFDCSAVECAKNGFYLANDVSDWKIVNCRSERNGGAGFALNYGASNSTIQSSSGNRNRVDGCQFSEGCGSGNALIDCVFNENDIAGINCKEKKQKALRCRMEANGEAGAIAQNNTDVFEISDSIFIGNNRADNGTMNLALEDHAKVVSTRNIFVGPYGKGKSAVNVRLIGRSSLQSVTDCFIDADKAANVVASIRVATTEPSALTISHGSFYNVSSKIGRVIDCRGASKLELSISNTAVAGVSTCLSYDAGCKVSSSHNCYHNFSGGTIIDVSGVATRHVTKENLRGFARANGVEQG
ncbi:MAG: right-handed parallel beta-helix repeat-containing protein, partial [Alphaproteobacteria bacterium]